MFSPPQSHLPSSSPHHGDSSPTILVSGHFAHFAELNGTTLETRRTRPTALQEKNHRVSSVTSHDGRILVAVSQGGLGPSGPSTVSSFDFANGEPVAFFRGHLGDVKGLECLSPGGSTSDMTSVPRILSGDGSRVYIWNGMTGEKISKMTGVPSAIYRILSLPPQWSSSTEILVGASEGFVGLYNLDRSLLVHQFEGHEEGHVWGISFDEARRIIVSVDSGGSDELKLWDSSTKECQKTIASYGYSVCCSQNLIAVGKAHTVDFWDIRNLNTQLREVEVSTKTVWDICAVYPPHSTDSSSTPSFVAVSDGAEDNVALLTSETVNATISLPGRCYGCCSIRPSSSPISSFSLPPAPLPLPDEEVPAHALVLGASASRGETPKADKWPRDSVIRDVDNICTLFRKVHVQVTDFVCRQRLSKKRVLTSLRKFFADASRYLCIVYFTGHGEGRAGSRGNWILHRETSGFGRKKEYLSYSEFRDLWFACRGRNPSRRCLLILEACYSGEWVRKLSMEPDKRGLYIQSSCTENQIGQAFESDEGGEKGGWFTNWWRKEVLRLYKDFYTAERAERDSGIRTIKERPPDRAMFEVGDHSPLRGRQHPMCSSRRAFVFKCQANDERSVLYFGGRMFDVGQRGGEEEGEGESDAGDEMMQFIVWD